MLKSAKLWYALSLLKRADDDEEQAIPQYQPNKPMPLPAGAQQAPVEPFSKDRMMDALRLSARTGTNLGNQMGATPAALSAVNQPESYNRPLDTVARSSGGQSFIHPVLARLGFGR